MASRKTKIPMGDGTVSEGMEVPVAKSNEPWTELELEDGTILDLPRFGGEVRIFAQRI
jgi:hypothetical protein